VTTDVQVAVLPLTSVTVRVTVSVRNIGTGKTGYGSGKSERTLTDTVVGRAVIQLRTGDGGHSGSID
jgi:hypothetical protein